MKNLVKISLVLAAAALTLSGCNCFKKMGKKQDEVTYSCTPKVLTLNNGVVSADITVNFPAAYFNKKATLRLTPVIVFEGGEVAGTPKYVQGMTTIPLFRPTTAVPTRSMSNSPTTTVWSRASCAF